MGMSSITLNGDTSGSVQLTVPAVAGSSVVTIPAGTGTAAVQGVSTNIVSGTAVASSSGTAILFTGIPSWVKRITVMFSGVSTSGTSVIQLQLGSGSLVTTGYASSAGNFNNANATAVANGTTGIYLQNSGNSANIYYGSITLVTVGSNIWVASGVTGISNTTNMFVFGGGVTLSGALDRVNITTVNGTDTFDAGNINILYE